MEPDTLGAALKVVAVVVIGVPLLVFLLQERLIFMPQRLSDAAMADIQTRFPKGQSVFGQAADGTKLHAWHLPGPPGAPLVFYFGGNAEDVSWMLGEATASIPSRVRRASPRRSSAWLRAAIASSRRNMPSFSSTHQRILE
ncbi:hypothetical protein AYO46_01615 [Betaproteobacteria bacterium SCGC AG-212-J23]|nr:hypothetical protein AYO46_01615 [Betaproteobacteria bacterium SCGC AG-212-J23]